MGDWTHKFSPGASVTYAAGVGGVVGGQVVALTAVGTATVTSAAAAAVLGVASRDVAAGERFEVLRGGVQRCVASAAIAVGDSVKSAASGQVQTWAPADPVAHRLGTALTAATAAGNVIDVQWEK